MKYNGKTEVDKAANQVLAAWGDSSSDSEESDQGEDVSMLEMDNESHVFDSLFTLMVDTNDDEDKPVTFLETKENLKDYSLSKMKSFASVLIDS